MLDYVREMEVLPTVVNLYRIYPPADIRRLYRVVALS